MKTLKASHTLEMVELKKEHSIQFEEMRSKVTITMAALETEKNQLKKCEMMLEKERERVDILLGNRNIEKERRGQE